MKREQDNRLNTQDSISVPALDYFEAPRPPFKQRSQYLSGPCILTRSNDILRVHEKREKSYVHSHEVHAINITSAFWFFLQEPILAQAKTSYPYYGLIDHPTLQCFMVAIYRPKKEGVEMSITISIETSSGRSYESSNSLTRNRQD